MVFALGVGVGGFIKEIEGVSYLVFVSAGLIVSEALMRSTFECTYGSFWRLKYQNTFEGIVTTPVSAADVAFAETVWGATRAGINVVAVMLVLWALGVFSSGAMLFIPFIVLVGALNFSAMGLIVAAKVPDMEYFNFYFAGFIFPTLFLAGTYFPLERLPEIVQSIMWVLPFTSIVDVTRGLIIGQSDHYLSIKIAYILLSTVLLMDLAIRLLVKRILK